MAAHELPRVKGSFVRGRVDAFTLTGERLGRVEALTVWHEPDGPALGGGWSVERVELEDRHKGGWVGFWRAGGLRRMCKCEIDTWVGCGRVKGAGGVRSRWNWRIGTRVGGARVGRQQGYGSGVMVISQREGGRCCGLQ